MTPIIVGQMRALYSIYWAIPPGIYTRCMKNLDRTNYRTLITNYYRELKVSAVKNRKSDDVLKRWERFMIQFDGTNFKKLFRSYDLEL